MNKRHFQLLEETLKSGQKSKENIKIKAASVIKSENIGQINERINETLKPLPQKIISKEVEYRINNKEKKEGVEVVRLGDKIEEIIVYCKCGEIFRIQLDY